MKNVVFPVLLFVCGFLGLTSGEIECGANQVYAECVDTCHITCRNYQNPPKECPLDCREGCNCKPGYVWFGNVCIPKNLCPRGSEIICPVNKTMQYTNIVIKTCDNLRLRPTTPGCYCKPNYYYNRLNGKCVTRGNCPKDIVCPVNEEKEACVNPCPLTCRPQHPHPCPLRNCEPGCKCKPPYVRDMEKGRCVLQSQCPAPKCRGEHEEYRLCDTKCPRTCPEPNRKCPRLPCGSGCFCKPGYIREYIGGPCVRPDSCPLPSIVDRSTPEEEEEEDDEEEEE